MYRHLVDATSLEGAGAKVAVSDWAPEFLDSHQNDALISLAEGVVPGSTKAQVNRVIDLLLTVETAENRRKFAAALTAVDGESRKRFSRPIADLPATQLDELLSAASTEKQSNPAQGADSGSIAETNQNTPADGHATLRDHFENLKGWIVATYYSSEPGIRELGWNDDFYYESPPECSHPEGHQ
jgi:Gluconate 2-dehydrogenase subunit 3